MVACMLVVKRYLSQLVTNFSFVCEIVFLRFRTYLKMKEMKHEITLLSIAYIHFIGQI